MDFDGGAETFEGNSMAPVRIMQALMANLRASTDAKLVTIPSQMGALSLDMPMAYAYCASKAAVIQFTRVAALELARDGIQVNAIAPGYVETDMTAEALADESVRERINRRIPAQRVAQPEELGPLVTFLASAESDYMTGETITMDGGFHL